MSETPFSGPNLTRMATILTEAISDNRLECYPSPYLMNDLLRVRLKVLGTRLQFPTDARGSHGDRGAALVLALLGGAELAAKKINIASAQAIGSMSSSMTQAELEASYWARVSKRMAREQAIMDARFAKMKSLEGSSIDHPLRKYFRRIRSDRI